MAERQSQRAGSGSTNVQAGRDVNVGLTYEETRQIAMDVFRANFQELAQVAAEIATVRAQRFVDNYIKELQERHPNAVENANDPDLQFCMANAAIACARTGDADLEALLVDLLVDRSDLADRDLRQVALDEALLVAPKLVSYQFDIITMAFLFRYTVSPAIRDRATFSTYLKQTIVPLIPALQKSNSCYQHLEYAACASIQDGRIELFEILRRTYSSIFHHGFPDEEINRAGFDVRDLADMLAPAYEGSMLHRFVALNERELRDVCKQRGFDAKQTDALVHLIGTNLMQDHDVLKILTAIDSRVNRLVDVWNDSPLGQITLTTVGIAIAVANIRRRFGVSFDLKNWIA